MCVSVCVRVINEVNSQTDKIVVIQANIKGNEKDKAIID